MLELTNFGREETTSKSFFFFFFSSFENFYLIQKRWETQSFFMKAECFFFLRLLSISEWFLGMMLMLIAVRNIGVTALVQVVSWVLEQTPRKTRTRYPRVQYSLNWKSKSLKFLTLEAVCVFKSDCQSFFSPHSKITLCIWVYQRGFLCSFDIYLNDNSFY